MQKKTITIRSNSVLAVDRHFKESWLDVWLYWKNGPNRPQSCSPCLIGLSNVKQDLKLDVEFYEQEVEDAEDIICHVQLDGISHTLGKENKIPDIYTKEEFINRQEAEKMLSCYLCCVHGIQNPKFKWVIPEIFVIGE